MSDALTREIVESDEDSAPESISFSTSKLENAENSQRIREHINSIRESQKKKRIERQEKYIEQKKKKFENLKLSDDVLNEIEDKDETNESNEDETKSSKLKSNKKSVKISFDSKIDKSKKLNEQQLENTTLSDFIPLKTYSEYGISVVNLANTNKKPLVASDRAKSFKSVMYDRKGVVRHSADERIALLQKRTLVKRLIK